MIFGGDILSMLIERKPHPHFLPHLLFKGLWLSPHCGHLACAPRRCLPTPTPEQDCALRFHGRVHHPRLFLSFREDQYITFWDTGLPPQSLTPLSGHSLWPFKHHVASVTAFAATPTHAHAPPPSHPHS